MNNEFQPCADCVNPDACRSLEECVVQKAITEDVAKDREENDELR